MQNAFFLIYSGDISQTDSILLVCKDCCLCIKTPLKVLLDYSNIGHLNDVQRNQAVGMIMGGMSYHEVARRMNRAPSTIMRLVERHNVTGPVKDRERPGRQRVTSAREDRHIVLLHLCGELHLSERHVKSFKVYRGNILTPVRRRNRELWCQQHLRWTQQWKSVVFTEES